MDAVCAVDGCGKVAVYARNRFTGKEHSLRRCRAHLSAKNRGRWTSPAKNIGDSYVDGNGYVMVRVESGALVHEHRVVMEKKLGRPLRKGESVHHKNGKRTDNAPDNLELWVGPIRAGQRASEVFCPHCEKPWFPDSVRTNAPD